MPDKKRLIEVTAYDPQWVARYREEAAVLRSLFGEEVTAIHHVGSTSIPEIPAKPVIDILLEVRDIDTVDQYNDPMRELGYVPRGEYGLPRRRYFPKIEAGKHTYHVHTWQSADPSSERHISFRDYLIAHPTTSKAYGSLKKALAEEYANDAEGYMDGKNDFIQETERRAIAWRRAVRAQTIETERLALLPLNPAQLSHYLYRPAQLEAALQLTLSRRSPSDPVRRAIRSKIRKTSDASLATLLWNTYWLVAGHDGALGAGLIGFKGAPDANGMVEIGYGIDPDARGLGYATEAAAALVGWALSQPGCAAVAAETEKSNEPSIRVLEKVGFDMVRETEDMYCWIMAAKSKP